MQRTSPKVPILHTHMKQTPNQAQSREIANSEHMAKHTRVGYSSVRNSIKNPHGSKFVWWPEPGSIGATIAPKYVIT